MNQFSRALSHDLLWENKTYMLKTSTKTVLYHNKQLTAASSYKCALSVKDINLAYLVFHCEHEPAVGVVPQYSVDVHPPHGDLWLL